MKCLVVDDSETVRAMLANLIGRAKESHEVVEASNERTAMKAFGDANPDVVFLDMALGDDDGVSVMRKMLAARPSTVIVLITALSPENPRVVEAVSMGAFSYLRKPVRAAAIENVLNDVEGETGHLRRVG